jgi:hypothetical protein
MSDPEEKQLTQEELEDRFGAPRDCSDPEKDRFGYTLEQRMALIRQEFAAMATVMNNFAPKGRELANALDELESAGMWTIKAMSKLGKPKK